MVRLPDPVTRMPSTLVFGHGLVELLQQVVGGLNGAAGDAAIVGEHQWTPVERRQAELGVGRT